MSATPPNTPQTGPDFGTGPQADREWAVAYVLGLLDPAEVVATEARRDADAGFATRIAEAREWLAPLDDMVQSPPPPGLLEDILAEIQGIEDGQASPAPARPLRRQPVATGATMTGPDLRRSVSRWRAGAIAASLIAAGLGFAWIGGVNPPGSSPEPSPEPSPAIAPIIAEATQPAETPEAASPVPAYVSVMTPGERTGLVVVVYDPATDELLLRLDGVDLDAAGWLTLWRIPEGGAPEFVQTLAALDAGPVAAARFAVQPDSLAVQTDTLAISLEPEDVGIPSAPAGPVLYTGTLTSL